MKKKSKIFIVEWELFPFDVLVCLGCPHSDILKWIKRTGYNLNETEIESINGPGLGRTTMLEGGQTILWTRECPRLGSPVLAHEIFHAVSFLAHRVGFKLTEESDEVFAYAIQHLTQKINEKI